MNETFFMTGATGVVGRYILAELLKSSSKVTIKILIRPHLVDDKLVSLKKKLTELGVPRSEFKRLQFLCGDVSQSRLGLDITAYRELTATTHVIFHSAALTNFDLPLEQIRSVNVRGTQEIIQLAKQCPRLEKIGFCSTVYICGDFAGELKEQPFSPRPSFINTYEQTKFEAEQLIFRQTDWLPYHVYRLSTILGDSRTGSVPSFKNIVIRSLRLQYQGLAPMLDGHPNNFVELVNADYIGQAVAHLILKNFHPQTIYHLIAGLHYSYQLGNYLEQVHHLFGQLDPKWKMKNLETPMLVDKHTYAVFCEAVHRADDVVLMKILQVMQTFIPHLSIPTTFDIDNTARHLPATIKPTHIRSYLPKVISYCLAHKWKDD